MRAGERDEPDDRWWLVIIVAVALIVRFWGLWSWGWEEDELYTLRDARDLGVGAVRSGQPGVAGRPIYYLLQHVLLKVLPDTPFFLRLPAFAFGVLGVVATWWAARRIFGGRAGLVAATMAALSPWHLFASQFARYWSLVYLESALFVGALFTAATDEDPRWYRAALGFLLLGTLTHPTFLFPIVGLALAITLIDRDGRFGFRLPSRAALMNLWVPFGVLAAVGYLYLRLNGKEQALQNSSGRGLGSTLALIPGMVQWMEPVIAGAGLVAALYLALGSARGPDRRWGWMALFGTLGAFLLLEVASLRTAVYADYGISVLPFALIGIGGLVQRLGETQEARPALVRGVVAILVIGVLPATVSHLMDGTRFDYRPAYALIRSLAPERPVFGGIEAITKQELANPTMIPYAKAETLPQQSGFWFLASQRRYGLREGGPMMQRWIDWNCRRLLSTEKPRLDYRLYRTELYWCGTDPVPAPTR